MLSYKSILNRWLNDSLDNKTFDEFKKDIATKISKVLTYYKQNIPEIDIFSYVDDIVQEVFLIITKKLPDFYSQIKTYEDVQIEKMLRVWIYKIIQNTVSNFLKGKLLLNKISLSTSVSIEDIGERIPYGTVSSATDLVGDKLSKLFEYDTYDVFEYDIIERLFSSLNEQEKKVVNLLLAGLNQKNIAKILNISEATISRIVNKIKEKFDNFLRKDK